MSAPSETLVPLAGSGLPPAGLPAAYLNPKQEISLTLALRRRPLAAATIATWHALLELPPHLRRYPSHAEVADATGSNPTDAAALTAYFAPLGVQVKATGILATLDLTGTVAALELAFHTSIAAYQPVGQRLVLAASPGYHLPASLAELVVQVLPLQEVVRKESRRPTRPLAPVGTPAAAESTASPLPSTAAADTSTDSPPAQSKDIATALVPAPGYSIPDLGQAYGFPAGVTGVGEVIGFVELGGKLNQADLKQFFAQLGLKKPRIVEVGTVPTSGGPTDLLNNAEVALDLQVAGALAPQARLVVYYGATLIEALRAVVADEVNRPTILSVSWAGSEYNYSAAEVQTMNLLLYQASVLGITVVAASADYGAYNRLAFPNVSLPSSNPLVLGCGGTIATLTDDGTLAGEIVWNEESGAVASGGGYSALYPQPHYQQAALARYPYQRSATRGVPDVAADASLLHGYRIVLHGQETAIGGTSGATPFVAALLALVSSHFGYRLGFLNHVLYGFAGSDAFRPITQGNNQLYPAAPTWNPCTGLGSLVGTKLLALLTSLEHAPTSAATGPASGPSPDAPAPADEPAPGGPQSEEPAAPPTGTLPS